MDQLYSSPPINIAKSPVFVSAKNNFGWLKSQSIDCSPTILIKKSSTKTHLYIVPTVNLLT